VGCAELLRHQHQVNAVTSRELVEQVGDVGLDGSFADLQRARDVPVTRALADQVENLVFARGQAGGELQQPGSARFVAALLSKRRATSG
jgi:hypothetical protein